MSTAVPPRAELLADGGEATASEEFFRCRPFLEAEGVTHTLRVETGRGDLLAPLIVREIPPPTGRKVDNSAALSPVGGLFDAVSPYGYPGIAAPAGVCVDPASIDFSATGLVSLFIRHSLGEPPLSGASERNVVQIADPELPPKRRGSDRNQINRNLRRGYRVRVVPGPEATAEERAGFRAAYEQTMRRTDAAERYFFGPAYFDRILSSGLTRLAVAEAPEGTIAAASILARSDGFLHYFLSGSADSYLRDSPMKNVVAALVELSEEEQMPLNLGGGIVRGDRLEEFKRGFANREQPWLSSEIVCDAPVYARLSEGREAEGFFPAYRATA